MDEVKVFYDREGQTLTVWFGDAKSEAVAEEAGNDVVLMKNAAGDVIGFEKLNFIADDPENVDVAFKAISEPRNPETS